MSQSRSKQGRAADHAKLREKPAGAETDAPRASSPHYRRARRDRGAETRAQLIEAALDVFGRLGYEGASTREIAKVANANLAAIVYHFGGKEALHLAVAEHVVGSILAKIGPVLASASEPAASATPEAARATLHLLIETMAELLLGSAEATQWARFLVREQLQPTAAFEVIYRFMGPSSATAARMVSTILDVPDGERVRLLVFTLLGQVLVFRVAQTLVMRRMEWSRIGESERSAIKHVIHHNVDAILEGAKS